MFFLFWVWSACVEHALTGMGSFCMQEGRLCLMNLRWWKAWSFTEVTYPHTLSPMPRHKKWWVQMSAVHFQALKLYLSSVILVAIHAWFTLFLSTYNSGTWESSDSWNPKLCTDPGLFWLPTVCDSIFFSQHKIQELENAVILVHEKKILSITSILPVLELVVWVSHHHQFYALFKVSAKVTCYCNCSHSFILSFSSSFPYWVFQFLLIFAPSLFLFAFFPFFVALSSWGSFCSSLSGF